MVSVRKWGGKDKMTGMLLERIVGKFVGKLRLPTSRLAAAGLLLHLSVATVAAAGTLRRGELGKFGWDGNSWQLLSPVSSLTNPRKLLIIFFLLLQSNSNSFSMVLTIACANGLITLLMGFVNEISYCW